MRIFPKTFLYTLTLLLLIALLANGLVYVLMPKVYVAQKQQELTNQTDLILSKLENLQQDQDVVGLLEDHAGNTQLNLIITVKQNTYSLLSWDGGVITQADVTSAEIKTGTEGNDTGNASEVMTTVVTACDWLEGNDEREYDGIVTRIIGSVNPKTITEERTFCLNGEAGTLISAVTLAPVDEAKEVIISLLPVSLVLCVVIAILFSLFYARVITSPIKLISSETVRMTSLDKAASCQVKTKDEFGVLADNVNGLYKNLLSTIESLESELRKVGAAEKAKTDFLRAASHELKTPVTAVSVILDNMLLGIGKYKNYDEWLPKCKALIDELSKKLRDIIGASQLSGADEPPTTIGIELLCADILAPYMLIARAKGLSVYVDWSGSFDVNAPPELLGRALSNIFSNAVQYTVPGGRIAVYCRERSLIVENECVPIDVKQQGRLFEPFFRPDSHTCGNGLGLYIVESVFRLLALDYSFEPMIEPDGMRFIVNF